MDDSRVLVERVRTGDRPALEQLLEKHLDGLHAFVRLQTGPLLRAEESCADLVQSVCREVLEDLSAFDYRGEAAFRQWLFKQALSKIRHRYRHYTAAKRDVRRRAGEEIALMSCYASLCTPSQELGQREAIARIEAAFARLPADYQQVILLHRIVGMSHAEIGDQMERSEGSVRMLLFRALARLGLALSEPR
jgi:RNA polymerase sigma-70 factor (ECF subfamily)